MLFVGVMNKTFFNLCTLSNTVADSRKWTVTGTTPSVKCPFSVSSTVISHDQQHPIINTGGNKTCTLQYTASKYQIMSWAEMQFHFIVDIYLHDEPMNCLMIFGLLEIISINGNNC